MTFVPTIVSSRDLPLPGDDPERHYDPSFLRVVHGGKDDPERKFMAAYHAANIARAERELADAFSLRDHWLSRKARVDTDADPHGCWAAFDKMREAIVEMACTPACTKSQLRMKRRMIGNVWLKAEGDFYEGLRARVAADEARLTVRED